MFARHVEHTHQLNEHEIHPTHCSRACGQLLSEGMSYSRSFPVDLTEGLNHVEDMTKINFTMTFCVIQFIRKMTSTSNSPLFH